MLKETENLTETVKNVSELANKAYDDGLKEPVSATGSLVALVPRAIKAALWQTEKWILEKENNIAETKKLLNEKLVNVNPDNIVAPQSYVAIPAIQALSYCYDSYELRNLYANLLARAMIKDEQDKVHPAFVDIIKQMSPVDAAVFKLINSSTIRPLINILWMSNKNKAFVEGPRNITWISEYKYEIVSLSINNLFRQNLIDSLPGVYYEEDYPYKYILDSSTFQEYIEKLEPINDKYPIISFDFQIINVTPLGKSFYDVCIKDL